MKKFVPQQPQIERTPLTKKQRVVRAALYAVSLISFIAYFVWGAGLRLPFTEETILVGAIPLLTGLLSLSVALSISEYKMRNPNAAGIPISWGKNGKQE